MENFVGSTFLVINQFSVQLATVVKYIKDWANLYLKLGFY
jgi:hypothetical protein